MENSINMKKRGKKITKCVAPDTVAFCCEYFLIGCINHVGNVTLKFYDDVIIL